MFKKSSLAGAAPAQKNVVPAAPASDQTETQVVPMESVETRAKELTAILPESNPHGRTGEDGWKEILENENDKIDGDKVLDMFVWKMWSICCNFLLLAFSMWYSNRMKNIMRYAIS